jgi:hypothetical protein
MVRSNAAITRAVRILSAPSAAYFLYHGGDRFLVTSGSCIRLRARGWDTSNPIFQKLHHIASSLSIALIAAAIIIIALSLCRDFQCEEVLDGTVGPSAEKTSGQSDAP